MVREAMYSLGRLVVVMMVVIGGNGCVLFENIELTTETETVVIGSDYWVDGYCPGSTVTNPPRASDDCRGIAQIGCCDARGNALYCYDGYLVCQPCDNQCSWTSDAGYWCTTQDNGPDLTGQHAQSCSAVVALHEMQLPDDYWETGYCPPPLTNEDSVVSKDCRDVSYVGCCDGDANVLYCLFGHLFCRPCAGSEQTCSWYSDSSLGDYYWCTLADLGEDPDGVHPMMCPARNPIDTDPPADSDTVVSFCGPPHSCVPNGMCEMNGGTVQSGLACPPQMPVCCGFPADTDTLVGQSCSFPMFCAISSDCHAVNGTIRAEFPCPSIMPPMVCCEPEPWDTGSEDTATEE